MKIFIITLSLFFASFVFSQGNFIDTTNSSPGYLSNSTEDISLLKFTLTDVGVNTELSEIGATFFKNKFVIVSNKKRRHTPTLFNESTSRFNNNLYCTNVDDTGNLSFPLHFSKVLDTDFNEGSLTFNSDESRVFFVQTTSHDSKNYKLFTAELDLEVNGYWKNKKEVLISNDSYSIETPYIDRLTNKIYFSSNLPNGYGGFDLYKADITKEGGLVNIENLGPEVNTSKDEKYAYTTPDGNYIYFSSNGKGTTGGYDVFRASIVKSKFTNRVNIGAGLNTPNDEVGFMLINKTQGYISINKSEDAQNFDIYRFDLSQDQQMLSLEVVELKSKTKLPNVDVVITDEFGTEIYKGKTNINGNLNCKITPLSLYSITVLKEGYDSLKESVPVQSNSVSVNKVINLVQKKAEITSDAIVVENILFDFNNASIKEESLLSLNKVIAALDENPGMTIAINAHTDTKGSEKYNLQLSEKRAKSAYDFLIKNGVPATRVSYKGYGETQPLFDCQNCTDEQDQKNRRVEFKIVK